MGCCWRRRWIEGELVKEGMNRARRYGWNDVYTFTKAMGEQLLVKNRGDVPLAIVRPSTTEGALADPHPGWIHGLKVTDPLVVAYGRGIVPDFPAAIGAPMDLVPIDIVVNMAGKVHWSTVVDMDLEAWREAVLSFPTAGMLTTKHAARAMIADGRPGSIIHLLSTAAHFGEASGSAYTAAKAAVLHLTRSVAMELGEQGIRVNSISPGAIMTPIFGKALGMETSAADATVDKLEQPFTTLQPLPRSGKPADIANAALFLASDAASFINGHDLVVDGGMIGGRGWTESAEGFGALADALGLSNP